MYEKLCIIRIIGVIAIFLVNANLNRLFLVSDVSLMNHVTVILLGHV